MNILIEYYAWLHNFDQYGENSPILKRMLIMALRLIFASLGLQVAGYFYDGSFHSIGMMVIGIVFVGIIMMYFILRQWDLMKQG